MLVLVAETPSVKPRRVEDLSLYEVSMFSKIYFSQKRKQ